MCRRIAGGSDPLLATRSHAGLTVVAHDDRHEGIDSPSLDAARVRRGSRGGGVGRRQRERRERGGAPRRLCAGTGRRHRQQHRRARHRHPRCNARPCLLLDPSRRGGSGVGGDPSRRSQDEAGRNVGSRHRRVEWDSTLVRGRWNHVLEAFDAAAGTEPRTVDLQTGVVALVADIRVGPDGSFPQQPSLIAGQAVFSADDGVSGRELWRTVNSAAGIVSVDVNPGAKRFVPVAVRRNRGRRDARAVLLRQRRDDGLRAAPPGRLGAHGL